MSLLDDLQGAIQAAAGAAGPSVVGIGRHLRGAGVVVSDGHVLTNAHNLRGDEVTVTFADGRSTVGTVVGVDHDGDLAVISVDTAGATPISWAPDASVGIGVGGLRPGAIALGRQPGSRSGRSRPSGERSVARAGGGSRAASSTPRRWPPGRRAARCSTAAAGSSA